MYSDIIWPIVQTISYISTFTILDKCISMILNSPYYLVHSVHNVMVVYYTYPDVINTYMHYDRIHTFPTNMTAICLCFALHFYHIAIYWKKFRTDDWLHHGLMIGIALPVSLIYESNTLVGYSLFFTTGLPGGIDYALLFCVRNRWLDKNSEKKINAWLNIWIRSPGCISQAVFILLSIRNINWLSLHFFIPLLSAILVYWNGQYFMRQVIEDNARIS